MDKKVRYSNFDLLKLIAFIMVPILHFIMTSDGSPSPLLISTGWEKAYLGLLESLCVVAVPIFLLITGFFSANTKSFSLKKVVDLYIITTIYNLVSYLIDVTVIKTPFVINDFLLSFIPLNYYVNLYMALLVLMPLLNKLFSLERKQVNIIMILLTIMFVVVSSLSGFLADATPMKLLQAFSFVSAGGSNAGYTLIMFIYFYLCGAYIRRYDVTVKTWIALLMYFLGAGAMFGLSYVSLTAFNYDFIFIVVAAFGLFLAFKNIKLKEVKAITIIANCSLGVFILHQAATFHTLYNVPEAIARGFGPMVWVMFARIAIAVTVCVALDLIIRGAMFPVRKKISSLGALNKKLINLE